MGHRHSLQLHLRCDAWWLSYKPAGRRVLASFRPMKGLEPAARRRHGQCRKASHTVFDLAPGEGAAQRTVTAIAHHASRLESPRKMSLAKKLCSADQTIRTQAKTAWRLCRVPASCRPAKRQPGRRSSSPVCAPGAALAASPPAGRCRSLSGSRHRYLQASNAAYGPLIVAMTAPSRPRD